MARMTIEFNEQVSQILGNIATSEGRSKTEVLRRALGLYSYLNHEMKGTTDTRFLAVMDKQDKVLAKLTWL